MIREQWNIANTLSVMSVLLYSPAATECVLHLSCIL